MIPIILLHGALGAKQQLDTLKIELEAQGFPAFSFDFTGHGKELFKSDFGIERFAKDLLDFLNTNQLNQANIFGYSMGGYIALWLAHHNPGRINAVVTLGTKLDWSTESADREVRKLNADSIIEKIPAFAKILEQRHHDWRELLRQTASMMLSLGKVQLLTDNVLVSIKTPALICLGDQDDMADRKRTELVSSLLPNARFRLLENTPHPIEKVDRKSLANMLADFFTNPEKA